MSDAIEYLVGIREVCVHTVLVTANSKEEAITKALNNEEEDEWDSEYSHTMSRNHCTVEEK